MDRDMLENEHDKAFRVMCMFASSIKIIFLHAYLIFYISNYLFLCKYSFQNTNEEDAKPYSGFQKFIYKKKTFLSVYVQF